MLTIALAGDYIGIGLVLTVMVYAWGHISGACFNPSGVSGECGWVGMMRCCPLGGVVDTVLRSNAGCVDQWRDHGRPGYLLRGVSGPRVRDGRHDSVRALLLRCCLLLPPTFRARVRARVRRYAIAANGAITFPHPQARDTCTA